MSYTPTTWATGDVITAEKLNNMEDGIVNAGSGTSIGNTVVFEFTATQDPESNDKYIVSTDATVAEVKNAIKDGKLCVGQIRLNNTIYTLIFKECKDTTTQYSVKGSVIDVKDLELLYITKLYLYGDGYYGWSLERFEYRVNLATT